MEGIFIATLLPRQLIRGSTNEMLPGYYRDHRITF